MTLLGFYTDTTIPGTAVLGLLGRVAERVSEIYWELFELYLHLSAFWRSLSSKVVEAIRHLTHLGSSGGDGREIRIIAFEGAGAMGTGLQGEAPLIYLGHAGVSLDGDPRIFGFSPSNAAIEFVHEYYGSPLRFLGQGGAMLGEVRDDTAIFVRAYELFEAGLSNLTQVWQVSEVVRIEEFSETREALQTQLVSGGPNPPWYALPPLPPRGCNNCVTWPGTIGIEVLEPTGLISNLVEMLRQIGTPWSPRQSQERSYGK